MHHSIKNPQIPASPKRKDTRAILDPTAWESSEVGGVEAKMLNRKGKNKVSSIRSSLFQKAKGLADNASEQQVDVDEKALIFCSPKEATSLQAPLLFSETESLQYCDYGKPNKKNWALDILALVHNAVRTELKDLTVLLYSIQKMETRLRVGDFVHIRQWWYTCSSIILDFLDMEMRIIIPWIEHAVALAKAKGSNCDIFSQTMAERQKDIRSAVMDVSNSLAHLCEPPVVNLVKQRSQTTNAEKAVVIINNLDVIVLQLGDYMAAQEAALPATLTAAYKSEKRDRDSILRQLVAHLATNARKPDAFFVCLTRWMHDSKVAKSFSKALQEMHECNYTSLQTQFEMHHAGLVHQFKVKAGL